MANYSPAARTRRASAETSRRATREAERHIVGIEARACDDGEVDEVAIDYALRGWNAVRRRAAAHGAR